MSVVWLWVGAVDHESFWVRGEVAGDSVRLVVSEHADLSEATVFGPVEPTEHGVASIRATGLDPRTQYHYAFEVDDVIDLTWQGRARTFPNPGQPASFMVAAGTCGRGIPTGVNQTNVSNHPIYTACEARDPDILLDTGDLHYRDIMTDSPELYRLAFHDVLTFNGTLGATSRQGRLRRNIPQAYVWDDHDYASGPGINGDYSAPSRQAARMVYREAVPHYDLPAVGNGGTDAGIWQTFTYGRVRFVMTDVRSERSPQVATDNEDKVCLGPEQEAWFKDVLTSATEPLICWVNTKPWLGATDAGADHWAGYNTERTRLGAWIESIPGLAERMFIVSGDMHGLAIDDGTNNHWGGFPVFQLGAWDSSPSMKGEPYSHGAIATLNAYGTLDIHDYGDGLHVRVNAWIGGALWGTYDWHVGAQPPPPDLPSSGGFRLRTDGHAERETVDVLGLRTGDPGQRQTTALIGVRSGGQTYPPQGSP